MAEDETDSGLKVVVLRKTSRGEKDEAEGPVPGGATRASTVVPLHNPQSPLQALADAVAAAEPVDASRVAATRQALADGNYEVDATAIAEKLTALEKDLPTPPPAKPES